MASRNVISVPIDQIKVDFYVRKSLDRDHVQHLAELYVNGVEFPPIKVTTEENIPGYVMIDGRHRLQAYLEVGDQQVKCELVDATDRGSLIAEALKENMGGALPPRPEDIMHTVSMMLLEGLTDRKIADLLEPMPRKLTRKYLNDAHSELYKRRIAEAKEAVRDRGMTVQQAAQTYSVDIDRLKVELGGKKKKERASAIGQLKATTSNRYKSLSRGTAAMLIKIIGYYEVGEVDEKFVEEVFDTLKNLVHRQEQNLEEWHNRFDKTRELVKKSLKSVA